MEAMLRIKGETRVGHFHIECEKCGKAVRLTDLRLVGGKPRVKAKCELCDEVGDFDLHVPTWVKVVPGLESN